MRLIDADALPSGRVEWEDIVNSPTVEAVPVSLIEEHIRSYRRRAAAARGKSVEDDENAAVLDEIAWALKYVIQDWRERNETD